MNPLGWRAAKLFGAAVICVALAAILYVLALVVMFSAVSRQDASIDAHLAEIRQSLRDPSKTMPDFPPLSPRPEFGAVFVGGAIGILAYVPGLASLVFFVLGFIRYAHELRLQREPPPARSGPRWP